MQLHDPIERVDDAAFGVAVAAARGLQLIGKEMAERIAQMRAGDPELQVGGLEFREPPDEVEAGNRKAARISVRRTQQDAQNRLEIRGLLARARQPLDRSGDRRELARKARSPEVQLQKPKRVGAADGAAWKRIARQNAERGIVIVYCRNERAIARAGLDRHHDRFEQIACVRRSEQPHQLNDAQLQAEGVEADVGRERLGLLARVGRQRRCDAAIRLLRGVCADERFVEQIALPSGIGRAG